MDRAQFEKVVSDSLRETLAPIQRGNDLPTRQRMIDGASDALIFWLAMLSVEQSLAERGASISGISPELEELLVSRSNRIREAVASLS